MKAISDKKKSYLFMIFLLITLTFILSNIFLQEIRTFLLMEAENSLKEISQQCSVAIKNKLDSRREIISSLAILEDIINQDIPTDQKLNLLRKEVDRSKFLRIGISDLAGNAVTTDNLSVNIADRPYFQRAKEGLPTLSRDLEDRIGSTKNSTIIVHAVPIKKSGKIIGVLFATDQTSQLTSIIQNIYSGDQKRAFILSHEGKILADTNDEYHEQNFLDLISPTTPAPKFLHLKELLGADSPGAGTYQVMNEKKIVGTSKIDSTQGWYIAVTAPQNTVMLQANNIMTRVAALLIAVLLFICIAFIYFYSLNKKYQQEKENAELAAVRLQVKDTFLANISHEIRTPLNAITGMAYLLKSTSLSAEQQDYLKKIETMSNVLLGIVNDILDMSKISSGKLNLRPAPFLLSEVIQSIDHIFEHRIREKGLIWRIAAENIPDPLVHGDKQRLIQILINLINNAYKFTDQGQITLSVKLKEETKQAVTYSISVEDTGIGITPEDINKLFKPFEQLENSLTKVYEGTGLGLCICQSLLHAMESHLSVSSTKGKGSAFSFDLPLNKIEASEAFPVQETSASLTLPYGIDPILLVEDNEINAEIAGFLLDELFIKHEWANNGQIAVDKCRTNTYSIILMDIHMPVLNGYAAAKIIKEELHATSPIIALTATSLDTTTSAPESKYIDDYISKPFDPDHFKETLLRYLNQKQA